MMSRKLTQAMVVVALLCLLGSQAIDAGDIDPVDVALESEVALDFDDVTLDDALQTISSIRHIPIVSDQFELRRAAVKLDQINITEQIAGVALRKALKTILLPHGLQWIKRHDVLMITTAKAAQESYFETRVYKVTREVPVDRRTRSITSSVARDSWAIVGGKGDASPLPPKYIVISQSPLIHRDVASRFRRSVVLVRDTQRSFFDAHELDRTLIAPARIDYQGIPLAKVVKRLAEEHKIAIAIDQKAISESGIQIDKLNVSLRADNVPALASALSLLLETLHPALEWIVNEQTITITTKTSAEKTLIDATYDVQEITKVVDSQYLIESVEYNIAAESWGFGGGDGRIELTEDGKLRVHQSYPVHRQLRQFLADLRAGQKGEQ